MKKRIFIHIGGLYCSKEAVIIETILGSCVAVCLYDAEARIGGMNHILLPGRADLQHFDAVARYGINAMELLINKMVTTGAHRSRLVAKAFGGAHVLPSIMPGLGPGDKNIEFVMNFLAMEAIPLRSYNMGGHVTRRIYFHTDTGDVFLKRIPSSHYPETGVRERRQLQRVKQHISKAGEITLFES